LSTPIGKWVYGALEAVTQVAGPGKNMTAIHTLRFFVELNKIFLQDAAAMMVLHPERSEHALFQQMPCFHTNEFMVRHNRLIYLFAIDRFCLLLTNAKYHLIACRCLRKVCANLLGMNDRH
ncbi:MAG: hypothetical protein ACRCZG_06285, partial [Culicoidibacterales bacterium]